MTIVLGIDVGQQHVSVCRVTAASLVDLRVLDLGDARAVPTSVLIDRFLEHLDAMMVEAAEAPTRVVLEQHPRGGPCVLALVFSAYTYFRVRSVEVSLEPPIKKYGEDAGAVPSCYHARRRFEVRLASRRGAEMGLSSVDDERTACALLLATSCEKNQ